MASNCLSRCSRSLKRLPIVLSDIKLILMPCSLDSSLVVVVEMLYLCYTKCTRNMLLNKNLCTLLSLTWSRPFIEYPEKFAGDVNKNLPKRYEWLDLQLDMCKPCTDLYEKSVISSMLFMVAMGVWLLKRERDCT